MRVARFPGLFIVRQRAALVKKYGLAGIASWRRGFEKDNIWEVILEEIK